MQITRRNALVGAGAAAVVAGVPMSAVGASDPAIDLAEQLNTARTAWMSADNTFEEAAHRAGLRHFADRKALPPLVTAAPVGVVRVLA